MKHPYRPTEVNHKVQYVVRTCDEEALKTSYGQPTTTMSPTSE